MNRQLKIAILAVGLMFAVSGLMRADGGGGGGGDDGGSTVYAPEQLTFEKDGQVRNFFNLSVTLSELDFTEGLTGSDTSSRINVTGLLDFKLSGKTLSVENSGSGRAEGYVKMGKLYRYAAIDMEVAAQNHAGYTANAILALHRDAQNRILVVQRDNNAPTKTFSVEIFKNGKSVFSRDISPSGVDAPYTVRVHISGRYLSFFRVKDDNSAYLGTVDVGEHFDFRDDRVVGDFSVAIGARLDPAESVSFSGLRQYLSSGTGQADPRVLHYEDGAPIVVNNKIWLAMTTRGYDPIPSSHQGVYCFDLTTKEWLLTGDMSFDKGDGLKRSWHATDVFFDRNDRKWKFLTTSHGDDNKIYAGVCDKDPRFGITESVALLLDCGVDRGEDASIVYDGSAKKWRLAMCRDIGGGFNTVLLESEQWNGAYTPVAENSAASTTGILLQKVGGKYYVFQGRGEANYEVLSYPDLRKLDVLNVSPLLPDRNIWPVVIPVADEAGTAYHLLTFDREQVTGKYSYGNLHWYSALEKATGFFEYKPERLDPSELGKVYDIVYHTNGGNAIPDSSYTVGGETVVLPAASGREGYVFAGWYGSEDFEGEAVTEILPESTGSKELWAKWDKEVAAAVGSPKASVLRVYPNPVVDDLLTIDNLSGSGTVEVYSMSGALAGVYDITAERMVINVSALPAGAYTVKANGKVAKVLKR
ncbi:MAG: InlB B-repeat-containing protein [Prevotellaceae bacterium]|nr:InlB B-repeat-containing protein [Prevotellaceae bacterium]